MKQNSRHGRGADQGDDLVTELLSESSGGGVTIITPMRRVRKAATTADPDASDSGEELLSEVAKRPRYGVMPRVRPWEEAKFKEAVDARISAVNAKWGFPNRTRGR
jgi:hypothetical protein